MGLLLHSPFSFVLNENGPGLSFSKDEDRYFYLALKNAQLCMGSTYPNPAVGAVIAKDGRIIAQGYTHPAGQVHAEKHAIENARGRTFGATLYVTLEPCSHFGRTPPCADAIIDAGIASVIYGAKDPNNKIKIEGVKKLMDSGVEVRVVNNPHLKKMAESLIKPFKVWILQNRPYVVLKIATSFDKKISAQKNTRSKITDKKSDIIIHQLRRATDAVLIGANTARIDDPLLTARFGSKKRNKQSVRIVLSSDLNLRQDLQIFDISESATIIVTKKNADQFQKEKLRSRGIIIIECTSNRKMIDLKNTLSMLANMGITSLLIEPGRELLNSVMSEKIADEVWWFKSKKKLGENGVDVSESIRFLEQNYKAKKQQQLFSDEIIFFAD